MHESVNRDKAGSSWYIMALAYAAGEPGHDPVTLERIAKTTFSALGATPATIRTATPKGKVGKIQAFSEGVLAELLAEPATGALTISGLKQSPAHLHCRLYLRHNPGVALNYQPPGALYLVAECGSRALSPSKSEEASREFLRACAGELAVLHGGIAAFPNLHQARSEASLVGYDISKETGSFARRWNYDASNSVQLWQKARHVYWITLLGPALAKQAGGTTAAIAGGAVEVTDVAGSLIFAATANVQDSLAPDFSRKTYRIRQWLWPYLIQNPYDNDPA